MSREIAIIFNPSAGGGKAFRKKRKVEACFEEHKIHYDLFETKSEDHLIETAQRVVLDYPVIISAGGDTTANIITTEILNAKTDNILGILGLGSVNDLARELGTVKLNNAMKAIKMRTTKKIDIGTMATEDQKTPEIFLVSASVGLGVAVNQSLENWMNKYPLLSNYRALFQGTAGVLAIRQAFKNNRVPIKLSFESENVSYDIISPLLIFSNTSKVGGGFHISPGASLESKTIDCCIFNAQSYPTIIKTAYYIKRQKHIEKNEVVVIKNDSFLINNDKSLEFQADGKIIHFTGNIQVSLIPKALTVVANHS